MKKTLRTIISALLIAIIALSSAASAFATAMPETINWASSYGELEEHSRTFCYGNKSLGEGKTEIRNSAGYDDLVYFDFVAEEEKSSFQIAFPKVGEFEKGDLLAYEKETLGIYVSGHPIEEYQQLWKRVITNPTTDFMIEEKEPAFDQNRSGKDDNAHIAAFDF